MDSSGNDRSGRRGQDKRTGKNNNDNDNVSGNGNGNEKERKKGSSSKGGEKKRTRQAPLPPPVIGKGRLTNKNARSTGAPLGCERALINDSRSFLHPTVASQKSNTLSSSRLTNYFGNNPSTSITAASTQCSSTVSSIGTDGAAASAIMPHSTTQQMQALVHLLQRQALGGTDGGTTRHSSQRPLVLQQQPQLTAQALSTIAEDDDPNYSNQAGAEYLPLQMAQVQYVGAATAFLFVSFFYLALPLAANAALVLFAAFLVLLGRTIFSFIHAYAMQQWNIIQQQGLANYVPEAMRPYVDPYSGTTVHEFMTADGTFVRDHLYLMIYGLPGLTPEQQAFYINQLPPSRRQVIHQRGMVLPFLPEGAQRVVLGEEGFQRYQHNLGLDVTSVEGSATDAPPANVTFRATGQQQEDNSSSQSENGGDEFSSIGGDGTLIRRNLTSGPIQSTNIPAGEQVEEHPLFLQPWQEPQPSFWTVLRGIGRTALSLVAGDENGTNRPSEDHQTPEYVVSHIPNALSQENYNDDATQNDEDDMVWEVQIPQRDNASDHDSSSFGGQSSRGGAAARGVTHDNGDDNALPEDEYAQDLGVLTNAFRSVMLNFSATATMTLSSTVSPLLSYWTPIIGGIGVSSTVSWISMIAMRYPQAIPRWPHLTFTSGNQLVVAAFGGLGSGARSSSAAVRNRAGGRDWGIMSIGLFSLATLGSAGGMLLLQRQLRAAAEKAKQYNKSLE